MNELHLNREIKVNVSTKKEQSQKFEITLFYI